MPNNSAESVAKTEQNPANQKQIHSINFHSNLTNSLPAVDIKAHKHNRPQYRVTHNIPMAPTQITIGKAQYLVQPLSKGLMQYQNAADEYTEGFQQSAKAVGMHQEDSFVAACAYFVQVIVADVGGHYDVQNPYQALHRGQLTRFSFRA